VGCARTREAAAEEGGERQAAGGAWLGAGPAGERKIDGARNAGAPAAVRSIGTLLAGGRDAARPANVSTRCAVGTARTAAAAANEASGNAPAGASPTSTAAHAAANLPRIRASLRP